MSDYTKKLRTKLWTARAIDLLILFLPLIVYIFIALANEGVTNIGKVSVVGSVAVAAILVLINLLFQKRLRCPIWIILIGLYAAMKDDLMPLIILLACATVLDDLVLTPVIKNLHEKYNASKVYDDRMEIEDERDEEKVQPNRQVAEKGKDQAVL